jgi:hypothetical protein
MTENTKEWAENLLKQGVDITFVLDRSGSMSSMADDAEGGMNQYVKDRQDEPFDTRFTFIRFDNEYEVVYDAVPVDEVGEIKVEPRGATALLDAVGRAINETKTRIGAMSEDQRPKKVLFVILTDGYENASREFSRDTVKEMIKTQTDDHNWSFVFLGANQDAFAEAGGLGVMRGNAINFTGTASGISSALSYTSQQTKTYSCSPQNVAMNFFDGNENVDDVVNVNDNDSSEGFTVTKS